MAAREPGLTLGIEEEYLLVDPATGDLVATPPAGFMPACQEALGDQVTHELLLAQVEVGTRPCASLAEARDELKRLRRTVAACADTHGMALVAASTHPFAAWDTQARTPRERYDALARDYQAVARRQLVSGMHVHAGIEDDDLRIDLMGQLTYFLPHLLALSASSPFWRGQDTGMKAFRPVVFGDLPRSGLPEPLASFAEWRQLLADLAEIGLCDDGSKIWWSIRPSIRHPTLELRITDICTHVEDTLTLAALYRCILRHLWGLRARNQCWRSYRRILIEENLWRAQRYGIEAELADFGEARLKPMAALVDEIIDLVRADAEALGCLAEIERARRIVRDGTSADQQLAVYRRAKEGGADETEAQRAVVRWLIATTVAD